MVTMSRMYQLRMIKWYLQYISKLCLQLKYHNARQSVSYNVKKARNQDATFSKRFIVCQLPQDMMWSSELQAAPEKAHLDLAVS